MPIRLGRTTGSRTRRVAVHHHHPRLAGQVALRRQERLADPQQVLARLLAQADAGADAGMHEQVGTQPMRQRQVAQEQQVRAGDPPRPVRLLDLARHAPTEQRVGPAIGHPQLGRLGLPGGQGVQHHVLVIAHQVDGAQAGDGRAGGEPCHDRGTVRAAIDVVAEVDQHGLRRGALRQVLGDRHVQRLELVDAAVDVADRVGTLAGRQGGGGGGERDHAGDSNGVPGDQRVGGSAAGRRGAAGGICPREVMNAPDCRHMVHR